MHGLALFENIDKREDEQQMCESEDRSKFSGYLETIRNNTYKHQSGGHVVYLHTMELIQPHLLWLDLTVERRKLLCHSIQTKDCMFLYFLLLVIQTFLLLNVLIKQLCKQFKSEHPYRNTTSSTILTEISDRNPRSRFLFILFLDPIFSQQQTSLLLFHFT